MKKAVSLVLVLALLLCAAVATAEQKAIDGMTPRDITIESAGLNDVEDGVSPTTGRFLDEIDYPDGFLGMAVTGDYMPIMIQVSNANNGVGIYTGTGEKGGQPYRNAPVNGSYADVVYEALQKKNGSETRMTFLFSDTIPDYAGFVRSTRVTHARIRQEWNAIFCTSGYTIKDVPAEWKALGVQDPASKKTNESNPGIIYVGDYMKPWKPYVYRLYPYQGPNNEVFNLTGLLTNIVPKDHQPANHTWKFTDELPTEGDSGVVVYVTFGGGAANTDSRLEYDPSTNEYSRIVTYEKVGDLVYSENLLMNAEVKKVKDASGKTTERLTVSSMEVGRPITFSNVIVQGIEMKWKGAVRPDPVLVGTGNADYFMGGKHITGVWERTDMNSRTVFYGPDGKEISLQRGRTLIILMNYNDKGCGVSYE